MTIEEPAASMSAQISSGGLTASSSSNIQAFGHKTKKYSFGQTNTLGRQIAAATQDAQNALGNNKASLHDQGHVRLKSEMRQHAENEHRVVTAAEARKLEIENTYHELYCKLAKDIQEDLRELYAKELKAEVWATADNVKRMMREELTVQLSSEVKNELRMKLRAEVQMELPTVYRDEVASYRRDVKARVEKEYPPILRAELRMKLEPEVAREVANELREEMRANAERENLQRSLQANESKEEDLFVTGSEFSDSEGGDILERNRREEAYERELEAEYYRTRDEAGVNGHHGPNSDDGRGDKSHNADAAGEGNGDAITDILGAPPVKPASDSKHRASKRSRHESDSEDEEDDFPHPKRLDQRDRGGAFGEGSGVSGHDNGAKINQKDLEDGSGDEAGDDRSPYSDTGVYDENAHVGIKVFDTSDAEDHDGESGADDDSYDHSAAAAINVGIKVQDTYFAPQYEETSDESEQEYEAYDESEDINQNVDIAGSDSFDASQTGDLRGSSKDNAIDLSDSDSDGETQLHPSTQTMGFSSVNRRPSYGYSSSDEARIFNSHGVNRDAANGDLVQGGYPDLPDYDSDPEVIQKSFAKYEENLALAKAATQYVQQARGLEDDEEYEDEETLVEEDGATAVVKITKMEEEDDCTISTVIKQEVDEDGAVVAAIEQEEEVAVLKTIKQETVEEEEEL